MCLIIKFYVIMYIIYVHIHFYIYIVLLSGTSDADQFKILIAIRFT